MKCRLLRELQIPPIIQKHPFYSGFPENHEQAQNKPPNCKTKIAAPAGTGNGENSGKPASNSETEQYSTEALAARFPIIAAHFGFEDYLDEVAA